MAKHFSIIWPATNERYTPQNTTVRMYVLFCKQYPEMFEGTFVVPADAKSGGV